MPSRSVITARIACSSSGSAITRHEAADIHGGLIEGLDDVVVALFEGRLQPGSRRDTRVVDPLRTDQVAAPEEREACLLGDELLCREARMEDPQIEQWAPDRPNRTVGSRPHRGPK